MGVSFGNRQAILNELNVGDTLAVVPEPDNPYDPNAVRVETPSGEIVGYLSRGTLVCRRSHGARVRSKGRSRASGLIGITIEVAFVGESPRINAGTER